MIKTILLVSCAFCAGGPALARSWSFNGGFTGEERAATSAGLGYQIISNGRTDIVGPKIIQKIDSRQDEREARFEYALAWQQLIPVGGLISSANLYLGGSRFKANADEKSKTRAFLGIEYGLGMASGDDLKFLPSIIAGIRLRPAESKPVAIGTTEVQSTTVYAGVDLRLF
jgi:hypothetical protein